jgi:UDP:flavonoid glycosyltransferase YjiC (YdhE family)
MAGRCDLLIHHGGYGSCQTGLYTATPQVIFPTYSERESNARRVAALGAGEFIVPVEGPGARKQVAGDGLRATVGQVLAQPTYVESARRVSEKLRTYGGAAQAARHIEDWSDG